MKIYLGGSCAPEHRTMMHNIAEELRANDEDVYCPFELKIPNAWDYTQEEWASKVFAADMHELDNCDIFLMISSGRESTAGTNFEQGYAYALDKYIIVLQYTDAPTSLMTYMGAVIFKNSTPETICDDAVAAVYEITHNYNLFYPPDTPCTTTLT